MSNDKVNPSHLRLLINRQNLNFRELGKRLNIPVDTLKRWNRQFLTPDPNAGRQSGRARVFTPDECLILYLAGYLLRNEGYGNSDTGQILSDVTPWLLARKLMPSRIGPKGLSKKDFHELFIQKRKGEDFFRYDTKKILTRDVVLKKGSKTTIQENFILSPIRGQKPLWGIVYTRVVRISILISYGLNAIGWKRQAEKGG